MKILVVSQYFWPENFRINDLCSELVDRGHSVTVLTGEPNYPTGKVYPEFIKNRKNFNDYNGCTIARVPVVSRGKSSKLRLFCNYFSFVVSASIYGVWKLRQKNFDVIFVYEPSPITVGLPAILFKKLKNAPIVFWVLDLWPETLKAVEVVKSKKLLNYIGGLVTFIYKRCDLILGQSKAFIRDIGFYAGSEDKVRYFPSWPEDIFLKPVNYEVLDFDDYQESFNILFAGNIGEAQDFPSVLDAVEYFKFSEYKVKLFIVGSGRAFKWLQKEIIDRGLSEFIKLLGPHPLEKMPSYYFASDALLVTLKDSPVFSKTIPAKIQSYMASGKPILSMLSGEGSRVIVEADCGFAAEAGDSKKLFENIVKMINLPNKELLKLGENARSYSKIHFDKHQLITRLENWFTEVLTS